MKGVQASAGGGWSLNESPSEKEGKSYGKGLSKRRLRWTLNESPSEKEGKFGVVVGDEERHGCPQ